MRIFRSRPRPAVERLPLALPRLDGSGWPSAAGRPSFEASTYYEMGCRQAYEPPAHELADRLVDAALGRLTTGAAPEDEPYLRKVLLTAARIGAGIGLVERQAVSPAPTELDPSVAGALGQARRGLPAMPPEWALLGAWFVLAGHYLARHDPPDLEPALQALLAQLPAPG